MIGSLHGGSFDGAEFDMREWEAVPDVIYARSGGRGKFGVQLSRRETSGGIAYTLAGSDNRSSDDTFHYVRTGLVITPLVLALSGGIAYTVHACWQR